MKEQGRFRLANLMTALLLLGMGSEARAVTRFVDAGATGADNGTSWDDAYLELRDALDEAASDASITEIWVAGGTYKPTAGFDAFATFQLRSGVAIHGGFAGFENSLAQRDLAAGATILSGDIGAFGDIADNTFHVVTGSGADASAVLEGCTIVGGNAGLSSLKRTGGGLLNEGVGSAPTIINCTFRENTARNAGGGLYNDLGSPTIVNCVFRDNTTTGFGDGAGAYSITGSAWFVNCTFLNNTAAGDGGGVFTQINEGDGCPDNANFFNCIFWGNSDGGALTQQDQIAAPVNFCPPEFTRAASNPFILRNSCIQFWDGVLGGPINTGADPIFADADGRLGSNSSCIDFGDDAALPLDVADLDSNGNSSEPLPIDRDGRTRVVSAAVDAGAFEFPFDCNTNGVLDDLDLAGSTSTDCDGNGVPDECDPQTDCNTNGTPDRLDITAGTSTDCNVDCLPDECMISGADCNTNGTLDACDLSAGTSSDCNSNGTPDGCEPDCNVSGAPDDCDIAAGTSSDCNTNALPDECEAPASDCNGNNVPDTCELAAGSATDCNANDHLDICDITGGTSDDCDDNLIPDDCALAQRFFVLDNAAAGAISEVQRFHPGDPGLGAPVAVGLPIAGNDRGLTAFDGAGQLLSCDEDNARVLALDVFRGIVVRTTDLDRPVLELAYDPSTSRLFATATDGGLYRIDLATGMTTFVNALPGASPTDWVCLAFDDITGKLLGASQSENRLFQLDPNTGAGGPLPQPFGASLGDLAVDFVDGTIYGVGLDGALYRIDRGTGVAHPILTVPGIDGTAAGLAILRASDCTGNGVLDRCEITAGSSSDCNHNALPDECDVDCNSNGSPDACDATTALDWDGDGQISIALGDLRDYAGFPDCLGGPNQPPHPSAAVCTSACLLVYDVNDDGDVDLDDFAAVQALLAGP